MMSVSSAVPPLTNNSDAATTRSLRSNRSGAADFSKVRPDNTAFESEY